VAESGNQTRPIKMRLKGSGLCSSSATVPTFHPRRISQHSHILYSLIVRKLRCGSLTLHFLPRTRPVSALPLSFTTVAVSSVSQISLLQILKASYSLRHDRTVATVQLTDSFDISDFNIASYPRNYDYGWRS